MSASCVSAEAMVVSEIGETLSPNVAPPMMAPHQDRGGCAERAARGVQERPAHQESPEARSRGGRYDATDDKRGDDVSAALDACLGREPRHRFHEPGLLHHHPEHAGEKPG